MLAWEFQQELVDEGAEVLGLVPSVEEALALLAECVSSLPLRGAIKTHLVCFGIMGTLVHILLSLRC